MKTEEVKALMQNVLTLLQKADYRASGGELMQIAATIQAFHQWAGQHIATLESNDLENTSN